MVIPEKCKGCGKCCIFEGLNLPDGMVIEGITIKDNKCIHLNKDNECDIYEDRPKICRGTKRGGEACINALKRFYKKEKVMYNYITTNLLNNKQYIGTHSTSNIDDGYLGSGKLMLRAIKKYGKEGFKREVLCKCETIEEAYVNESIFIEKYNTLQPNGYNISPKGGHGIMGSMAEETKRKISKTKMGEKNPMYGRLGKDNPNYGKHPSEETRKRMSESRRGKKAYWYGKTGRNNPNSKPLLQYTKDGLFIREWECAREVQRVLGFHNYNVSRCALGKRFTAYKFIWKFKTDEE